MTTILQKNKKNGSFLAKTLLIATTIIITIIALAFGPTLTLTTVITTPMSQTPLPIQNRLRRNRKQRLKQPSPLAPQTVEGSPPGDFHEPKLQYEGQGRKGDEEKS